MTTPADTLADLWDRSWQDEDFQLDIKAQDTGVTLTRALFESGKTQAQLARELNWKPSRVSRVFSGKGNLTLRTLHKITSALGFEFDIILRKKQQRRAPQPWEHSQLQNDIYRWHRVAHENHMHSHAMLQEIRSLNRLQWQRAAQMTSTKRSVPRVQATSPRSQSGFR